MKGLRVVRLRNLLTRRNKASIANKQTRKLLKTLLLRQNLKVTKTQLKRKVKLKRKSASSCKCRTTYRITVPK